MPPKISIFIPVYKESDLLESLLNSLLIDPYNPKEIFVVIDEPTEKSMDVTRRFCESVNFVLNGDRNGKANVLNDIVRKSDGEIILFLDSDVTVPNRDGGFLQVISEEAEKADIMEIKKKIFRDSFLAKLVYYDYLSFSSSSIMFSKMLGRCLGLNGAAFAIRREVFESLNGFRRVISEDLDMGIRAFMKESKFRFVERAEVYIKVSPSWRQWFNQRKRWGIGAALWLKDHFRELLVSVLRYPKTLLPSLLLILPALPLFMISMLIPDELYFKALSLFLLVLATRGGSFLYPPLLFVSSVTALKNAIVTISSFVAYLVTFYSFARRLEYRFDPVSFAIFYFVYSPIWFFILIISIVRTCLKADYAARDFAERLNWRV